METRASYLLVGSFVLVLLAGLFGFVVWLSKVSLDEGRTTYRIYFSGSVTGLQQGSPVRYNGIAIGTVTDIRIAPDDVEKVLVTIEVRPGTPIKQDAIASLELQGITGTAFVQITGGRRDSPDLVSKNGEVPVIASRPSTLSAVFAAAPRLFETLIGLSDKLSGLLSLDNQRAITGILTNINTLSAGFAGSAGEFRAAVADMRTALGGIDALVGDLRKQVDTVAGNADRTLTAAHGTVTALDTQSRLIATDLRRLTGSLNDLSQQLTGMVSENRRPVRDFTGNGLYEAGQLITELRELANNLSRLSTRIERDPAAFLLGGTRQGVPVK